MEDDTPQGEAGNLAGLFADIDLTTRDLQRASDGFARSISSAFARAIIDGKRFDDVLRGLALRLSDMVLRLAMKPVENALSGVIGGLFNGVSGGAGQGGLFSGLAGPSASIKPFAAGGVIAAPTYFPMTGRGFGVMGEAGPEAILPLRRGADGRLGVATDAGGTRAAPVYVTIQTPDADSFRRSEAFLSGMVSRAVARGRRHE